MHLQHLQSRRSYHTHALYSVAKSLLTQLDVDSAELVALVSTRKDNQQEIIGNWTRILVKFLIEHMRGSCTSSLQWTMINAFARRFDITLAAVISNGHLNSIQAEG